MSAITVIAAQGGAQLAWAALRVLAYLAAAGLLGAATFIAAALLDAYREHQACLAHGAVICDDELGEDTVPWDAPACPWCDDPSCIDSALCTCDAPCGPGYCKAPRGYCRWCAYETIDPRVCYCEHDCGAGACRSAAGAAR